MFLVSGVFRILVLVATERSCASDAAVGDMLVVEEDEEHDDKDIIASVGLGCVSLLLTLLVHCAS